MTRKGEFLYRLKYTKDQREGRDLWEELIDRNRKRPINEQDRSKIGAWLRSQHK